MAQRPDPASPRSLAEIVGACDLARLRPDKLSQVVQPRSTPATASQRVPAALPELVDA